MTVELPGGTRSRARSERRHDRRESTDSVRASPAATASVDDPSRRPRSATDLDQAPVDVTITRSLEEDALAVPVTALLALAGGGYGSSSSARRATTLVAVETGVYADGYVQVAGDGIAEGAARGGAAE